MTHERARPYASRRPSDFCTGPARPFVVRVSVPSALRNDSRPAFAALSRLTGALRARHVGRACALISRHAAHVFAEHRLDELVATAAETRHEATCPQRLERAQDLGTRHRRRRIGCEQHGALRDARRHELQVLLLPELAPVERERPLELAQRLLVRDREEVRSYNAERGIAHEVVESGAHLHRVLGMSAGRVQQAVDTRVVDRDLLLSELLPEVGEPVVRRDAEAMPAGLGEIDRDREPVEGPPLLTEELLEDPLLRAEERVRDPLLGLEARPHDVEDSRTEAARGLELVEGDDHSLAGPRGEGARQVERAIEEALRVGLASELQSELDVLV